MVGCHDHVLCHDSKTSTHRADQRPFEFVIVNIVVPRHDLSMLTAIIRYAVIIRHGV